jgi:hypothetical protein
MEKAPLAPSQEEFHVNRLASDSSALIDQNHQFNTVLEAFFDIGSHKLRGVLAFKFFLFRWCKLLA